MLGPSKQKYRKHHKINLCAKATKGCSLHFGDFGLQALNSVRLSANQIEAARKAAVGCMQRSGKFFIRVFPDVSISQKPNEVRMGKGKGDHAFFAARVLCGRIVFEISGVSYNIALKALNLASDKLPLKTKLVVRRIYE